MWNFMNMDYFRLRRGLMPKARGFNPSCRGVGGIASRTLKTSRSHARCASGGASDSAHSRDAWTISAINVFCALTRDVPI